MTIDDAASILDVTEGQVKRLLRYGVLKGLALIRRERVVRWLSVDGHTVRARRKARAGR
jgi:hypothetical protein